ncbi:MAG: ATP-binding protein [Pseudomonadota bacterium]
MSNPSTYHLVARGRRAEIGLRFGFAFLISLAAGYASEAWWPALWLAAVGVVQLANLAVGADAARDATFQPSRLWVLRYLAVQFLNSAVFVAMGPYLWFACGPEGRLIAMVVLMGGLLNFGTHPRTTGKLLFAGSLPYAVMLGGLPLLTVMLEPHVSLVLMAFLTAGSALYLLHVLKAVRRRDEAVLAMTSALGDAERASEAKSTFLAIMSHEIRTPLNGVLGMAQAMAADDLPDVQRRRLGVIQQSGNLLLTLLNDLLDLAKIEAAKFDLEDGVLDVFELAGDARAAFAVLAADKGVALSINVSPDAEGQWRTDPTRVRQILYNLLSNAVKFTAQGEVEARLDLHPDGGLRLRVRDTGDGISEADQAQLFNRFIQVDASTTRRHGGTGLGLAISRELARLMGGDLTVASVLGTGSVFEAWFPMARADSGEMADESEPTVVAAGLRVLVAEDNETNRLVIGTLLEQLGIEADFVVNGAEAVLAWQAASWDLVLMDIQMPIMDGRTATRKIRQLEAEHGRLRTALVALTANAMRHQVAQYYDEGFDAVAPKPIELHVLIDAIEKALQAATLAADLHAEAAA